VKSRFILVLDVRGGGLNARRVTNQDAFTQAGDEDSVFPIRHFYQRWGAAITIERRPSAAARLHAAERALADPDPAARDQAVREAAEIVQAAHREVAGS
jgi:hypothetical protein